MKVTAAIILAFAIGMFCIVKTAKIIGRVAEALKFRTGLAGGLLQAIGTALPDMVIGILAAVLSLRQVATDYPMSVQLAIIAGSATLGSNIYNVLYASWCMWRQNVANVKNRHVTMFPFINRTGRLTPLSQWESKPSLGEIDSSLSLLTILSILTAALAFGLIFAGRVENVPAGFDGELFQFNRWMGVAVLAFSLYLLFAFRKSHHAHLKKEYEENEFFNHVATIKFWLWLLAAGVILFLSADTVIRSVTSFSNYTHIPVAIAGGVTALIGCMGEMTVVHQFSIHPHGTVIDAITGVAMDDIVTIIGACIIAIMGGIYLGSSAIVFIFVCILLANTLLIYQIARLKNFYLK